MAEDGLLTLYIPTLFSNPKHVKISLKINKVPPPHLPLYIIAMYSINTITLNQKTSSSSPPKKKSYTPPQAKYFIIFTS